MPGAVTRSTTGSIASSVLRYVCRRNTSARLAADHSEDRRPVVVEGAMTIELEGASARRIRGIGMASAFLTGVLVHLVGFDDAIGQC